LGLLQAARNHSGGRSLAAARPRRMSTGTEIARNSHDRSRNSNQIARGPIRRFMAHRAPGISRARQRRRLVCRQVRIGRARRLHEHIKSECEACGPGAVDAKMDAERRSQTIIISLREESHPSSNASHPSSNANRRCCVPRRSCKQTHAWTHTSPRRRMSQRVTARLEHTTKGGSAPHSTTRGTPRWSRRPRICPTPNRRLTSIPPCAGSGLGRLPSPWWPTISINCGSLFAFCSGRGE
jgi:hypothetical protein